MAKLSSDDTLHSMTGFASLSGDDETAKWDWEVRGVNGKGLDLRLRLPEGSDALERQVRTAAAQHVSRGNITVSLRVSERHSAGLAELDPDALMAAFTGLETIEAQAQTHGISLATMTAADIAAMPGVMATSGRERLKLPDIIASQIPELLAKFADMRATEGAALASVLNSQLTAISALIERALETAEARSARQGSLLQERIATLMENAETADPARLNQELAMLAVKADVTEEIDRLRAHVDAARGLLQAGGPVGRKLDFLMQEFNREANTLCSKSGSSDLTAIGLDMKVLIDQMREQVQNLE